jgi:predicted  nucleic acid-binding Zn-ribbon protein
MEIQVKVMELEYVLNETKEKLSFVQHQKSQLESDLADTHEKLNQKQNLVSVLEDQKTQLSSALDEVTLVSACESDNSRSDQFFFCGVGLSP